MVGRGADRRVHRPCKRSLSHRASHRLSHKMSLLISSNIDLVSLLRVQLRLVRKHCMYRSLSRAMCMRSLVNPA